VIKQIHFTESPVYKKIIVCSDIHGHKEPFLKLLDICGYDEHDLSNLLLVLGDVIDRGPHSIELLSWFYERRDNSTIQLLMGNHEHILLTYFDGTVNLTYKSLQNIGAVATMNSFRSLPEDHQQNLLKFISDLPLFYPMSNVLFSHAGCDFNTNNMHERFLWSKDFWMQTFHPEILSIFGHTPTCYLNPDKSFEPWYDSVHKNKICIDMGAGKRIQVGAIVLVQTQNPLVYDIQIERILIKE